MSAGARPATEAGTALAVVLWALLALAALSTAAVVTSITDLALARVHRDHAAALALAETGLAETLAVLAADPSARERADSLTGTLAGGTYGSSWVPQPTGARIVAIGDSRGIRRAVEARAIVEGGVRVVTWREIGR